MPRKKRSFSPEFRGLVALNAFKKQHTLAQLAAKHNAHPNQITWKREARQALPEVFGTLKAKDNLSRASRPRTLGSGTTLSERSESPRIRRSERTFAHTNCRRRDALAPSHKA
ncbi:MAG: hypothetical protein GXP62_18180 [Oligoflexia bacterium]|nr:hypothetical protein [Oligoflexia bacterium]